MAENWIKIKESLYKGAFLRNEKRGSSSESSSNRDWAEGELFRQEPLSIEIRNGTLETGNWTEVGEDGILETCGNHATSVSDEIDQEMKVRQNIRFFLRFFPLAHFDHLKLKWPWWPWDQFVWWNWPENKSWSEHLVFS